MPNPQMSERIRIRILESYRRYSTTQRKAELLLRNQQFSEERDRVGIPSYRYHQDAKWESIEFSPEWQKFNFRWWLDGWWDGNDATLWNHVMLKPAVYFRDPESKIVWILGKDFEHACASDQSTDATSLNIPDEGGFIYLKVNPWTSKENLRELEPIIRRLRKEVFQYSERMTKDFGRDLCLYDLHERAAFGGLSYSAIQIELRKHGRRAPRRETIIAAVRRIRSYIKRTMPIPARFTPRL